MSWLDMSWLGMSWLNLSWLDPSWLDLSWLDLPWFDLSFTWPLPYLTCPDLTCLDLTCLDLTCPDLTCLDLIYPDLICPDFQTPSRHPLNTQTKFQLPRLQRTWFSTRGGAGLCKLCSWLRRLCGGSCYIIMPSMVQLARWQDFKQRWKMKFTSWTKCGRNKCVLKWLLSKIQCFSPCLL